MLIQAGTHVNPRGYLNCIEQEGGESVLLRKRKEKECVSTQYYGPSSINHGLLKVAEPVEARLLSLSKHKKTCQHLDRF